MGDHRADIKISFYFHGKEYKMNASINYNGYDGVDKEVIKFFENAWEDGIERFNEELIEYEIDDLEKKERAELARLKTKYE